MVWQVNKQLTTVNVINATLDLAKCQTPGSKLYIKEAPPQHRGMENEVNSGCKHCRSPRSDTDDRQSHPVKARSCKNRCPTPTHTSITPSICANLIQQIQKVIMTWRNFTQHVRNLAHQYILQPDLSSFINIIITQQTMNSHSWTLVQKMNIHLWTMKSPQCLHIWPLHPQFHIQDLQGHTHSQHHNPQKIKTRSQIAVKPPQDNVKHHIRHLHTPMPGKQHCYPHTPCQLNNTYEEHSFQDHYNTPATDTNIVLTFHDLTDNNHCYYPVHHGDQTLFKDISICKYHFTCKC